MLVKELIRELTFHDMDAEVVVAGLPDSDAIGNEEIRSVVTEPDDVSEDEEGDDTEPDEEEPELKRVMLMIDV